MKSKTKNNKVPKSDKARLSDLTPKNDARAGEIPGTGPAPMPDKVLKASAIAYKKQLTL